MARKGENIFKRKDGRWEGRYIKGHEEGRAEIEIHCGHKRKREAVLKAGSKISRDVSINFASSQSVRSCFHSDII